MITKYALRNKILAPLLLITLCTCCALTTSVHAQAVHIPDPNLRAAVRDALSGAPITQASMRRLTQLDAFDRGIVDLTGLEYAINLKTLPLWGNPFADLTPIASLKNLTYLDISACLISDITALSNLTSLTSLNARSNYIVDIRPLANLTNLDRLRLNKNRITDVRPLANLTRLEFLEIHHNQIVDYSPLDALALSHFTYDQICEMTPLPLEPRLDNRDYPSIFTRWGSPNTNRPELSHTANIALHDLNFDEPQFGLAFRHTPHGVTIAGIIDEAVKRRDEFLSINTNMIFLMYIEIRSFPRESEPDDWPYWIRDANGNIIPTSLGEHDGLIDFTHPVIQDRIVQQAIAVSKCGLYDGIMFDYWTDKWPVLVGWDLHDATVFRGLNAERRARDNIVKRIRAATRPNFLIMGNNNRSTLPLTAPYINGGFMESVTPFDKTAEGIKNALNEVESTLFWLEENLREPHINGLEGWTVPSEPPDSPTNLRWMRVFTTLSLTHSDGYVSFKDSAATGHYWYDFWDADLGRSIGPKATLYNDKIPHLFIREFANGWAVYNHSGAEQTIMLPELASGVASGLEDMKHTLPNRDGEIYLRAKPANPADVNGDGVVNILDLVVVAQAFGKDGLQGDVNGDGVVNVFDLVFVAGAIGGDGAAPSASASSLDPSIISAGDVERWLAQAQGLGVGDPNFQRGIRFLEGLIAALTPKETTLLPNYPNPFNPETWIPYRLAWEAEVAITIYDTKGTPVRRLTLGNQSAGNYAERGKAAYWDGRNEEGEAVASGIYIYQFRAGEYAASRRMVVVK